MKSLRVEKASCVQGNDRPAILEHSEQEGLYEMRLEVTEPSEAVMSLEFIVGKWESLDDLRFKFTP